MLQSDLVPSNLKIFLSEKLHNKINEIELIQVK